MERFASYEKPDGLLSGDSSYLRKERIGPRVIQVTEQGPSTAMIDDYDYDWNYSEKTVKKASSSPGSNKPAENRKTNIKKADSTDPKASNKSRNPDRNENGEREMDTSVAVACLVFGIIGLLSSWLIIGLGFAAAAIVLAVIVIRNRYYGKGYAIGGLITSIIGLVAGIILPIVLITSLKGAVNDLQKNLMENLVNSMVEYANDSIPAYIEEVGNDYIRQYMENIGLSFKTE